MTISFKVSDNTKVKMMKFFEDKKRPKTPAYAVFQADSEDTVVTLYESGKVVFQGVSADVDADLWKQMEKQLNPGTKIDEKNSDKKKDAKTKDDFNEMAYYKMSAIGSDEVGTGDYFGPIVVTSAYVKKENIAYLEELGVKDSKKLTDQEILKIVPDIIKKIPYESIVVSNTDYNARYNDNVNMNMIKAIMHNKVLLKLCSRYDEADLIIMDQFAKPNVYYNYLKTIPVVKRDIVFLTKGEDKHLSVACASLISRYLFIKEMDKISRELEIEIPKGASTAVDEVAALVAKKYGFAKLSEVVKLNFKNTEKVKAILEQQKKSWCSFFVSGYLYSYFV